MSIWAGDTKIHELYTAGCGLYTIWVVLRAGTITYTWIPQGLSSMCSRVKEWSLLAFKSIIVASLLVGLVPLLLGLLVELVLVVPYRVPLDQSPVFFLWQVRDSSCCNLEEALYKNCNFTHFNITLGTL